MLIIIDRGIEEIQKKIAPAAPRTEYKGVAWFDNWGRRYPAPAAFSVLKVDGIKFLQIKEIKEPTDECYEKLKKQTAWAVENIQDEADYFSVRDRICY